MVVVVPIEEEEVLLLRGLMAVLLLLFLMDDAGISLGVAMDLCIRHGLTSALCQHLSSARDVIDLLDQASALDNSYVVISIS